ncbi:MAG: low temperature-induced protein [Cyanobacteriota bacterium]|nr:low temperature-induced protein [Cyanobacteriota bacterium]
MTIKRLVNINWRPIRFLTVLCFCTFLFFSSSLTALASSNPSQGVMPLKNIEKESREALQPQPRPLEEVQAKAKEGINGVQGGADIKQMKNPANAKSTATSVEEQVSDVLN